MFLKTASIVPRCSCLHQNFEKQPKLPDMEKKYWETKASPKKGSSQWRTDKRQQKPTCLVNIICIQKQKEYVV